MRGALLVVVLLSSLFLLTACGETPSGPTPITEAAATSATMSSEPTATRAQSQLTDTPEPPTTTIALSPSSSSSPAPTETSQPRRRGLSDQNFIVALKNFGLPIGETVIYTAETDPDKLLGRPNQYITKATWHDTRLPAPENPAEPEVSDGAGIEIWPDEAGAKRRMEYIQEVGKAMPALVEYDFVQGPVLVRVSKELTPAQAEDYRAKVELVWGAYP